MNIEKILQSIKPYSTLKMKLEKDDDDSVTFGISLDANLNDKKTMFAGSIYSAMVLCGWTLAYKMINKDVHEYDVVIKTSSIDYIKPVRTGASVRSVPGSGAAVSRRSNKSIKIKSELYDAGMTLCAVFSGEFIGLKKSP